MDLILLMEVRIMKQQILLTLMTIGKQEVEREMITSELR